MKRRDFLTTAIPAVAMSALLSPLKSHAASSVPATALSAAERTAMNDAAQRFMQAYGIPGLSIAITGHAQPVYATSFGMANRQTGEAVTPGHLFRIASLSKPITSAVIFTLIEQGKLGLSDHVFGVGAILGTDYGEPPYQRYVTEVTVEHLLTHTAGGWQNDVNDPMFSMPAWDWQRLIEWTIHHRPLARAPGAAFAYSNFGYCVLGRIIEKLSGMSYASYVRQAVLHPCGITDMHIAGNTRQDRRDREVTYYGQGSEDPYEINIHRMDALGGWIATPTDLVRFTTHLAQRTLANGLLKPATVEAMTTSSSANRPYAKGWVVNTKGTWWHVGSLPGSTAILVRTRSGLCWAALANSRRPASDLNTAIDDLMWRMARLAHYFT